LELKSNYLNTSPRLDKSHRTPRIELVFFDAGGGHRAAATALQMVIESQHRGWDVRLLNLQEYLDNLDLIRKLTGMRLQDTYNNMLRRGWTLGSPQLMRGLQVLIRLYHGKTVRSLESYWRESGPDMVVSLVPHFNRAMFESYAQVFPGRPFVTLLTDIADCPPHFWIERQKQFVICGSERAAEQARNTGYPSERIFRTSGMICHPKFYASQPTDRCAERRKHGLRPDLPVGLVLFGGHGSRAMLEIARQVERSNLDVQLIFICGKNEKLAAKLRSMASRMPRLIAGFTSDVPYYMHISDFFIGKPGPGSISEALLMGLPVIVERNMQTLPQERYNPEWVREKQVGMVVRNFFGIAAVIREMLAPKTLARFRANVAAVKNRAIFEVPDIFAKILKPEPV
jgi:1,2-diacylglycerol 3-beta-galactosyltransferase